MAAESRQCANCGNFDTLRPIEEKSGDKKWTEIDGRFFSVEQLRCVACGLSDMVQRDFNEATKGFEPQPGRPAPGDGRRFVVHPIPEPPEQTEASE